MRSFIPLTIGALLLASSAAPAAPREAPEARLARAIEGRVAGEPVDCINLRNIRSSKIIDHTAIIYDAGNVLYVNHPRAGRESLDQFDTLVTKTHSSELCSIDTVQLVDNASHMNTGTVFLGKFVPYKKVRSARSD
jgi:hypothetical protein